MGVNSAPSVPSAPPVISMEVGYMVGWWEGVVMVQRRGAVTLYTCRYTAMLVCTPALLQLTSLHTCTHMHTQSCFNTGSLRIVDDHYCSLACAHQLNNMHMIDCTHVHGPTPSITHSLQSDLHMYPNCYHNHIHVSMASHITVPQTTQDTKLSRGLSQYFTGTCYGKSHVGSQHGVT